MFTKMIEFYAHITPNLGILRNQKLTFEKQKQFADERFEEQGPADDIDTKLIPEYMNWQVLLFALVVNVANLKKGNKMNHIKVNKISLNQFSCKIVIFFLLFYNTPCRGENLRQGTFGRGYGSDYGI